LCPRAGASSEPTYRFDPRADRFVEAFFPARVPASGLTHAYVTRTTPASAKSLDAVYERNLWATNLAVDAPAWLEAPDAIDSYWLSTPREAARLTRLLAAVATPEVIGLVDELADTRPRFGSSLEKALFQRDVWQAFSFCAPLARLELGGAEAARRDALALSLARLLGELRLSEGEYADLLAQRRRLADPRRFADSGRWDLAEDYLPRQVLGATEGWHPLPFVDHASRHFRFLGARSFVHVSIRPPGMSGAGFQRYWEDLYRSFGPDIHLQTGQPPLPARTELLLVRTFGVFLEDGTYADSTFPEEVLMRLIKHQTPRLDLSTSDGRGTLLYQYRMSRRDLLAGDGALGLRRVAEDAPEFYGFFSEAPDPYNSYSDSLSTMRYNCIACHSEHQYGVGTVFSMTRPPVRTPPPDSGLLQDGMLEGTGRGGRFRLRTEEAAFLSALLPKRPE
jgi:hypothetical protein